MKRLFPILLLSFILLFTWSCTKDSPVPENQQAVNNKPEEDTPEKVDPMELIKFWFSGANDDDPLYGVLEEVQKQASFLSGNYYTCRYSYLSTSASGEPVYLTGRMSWPCNSDPEAIVAGCHITITENSEAPSLNTSVMSDVGITNLLLSGKALVVFPDYEGYGNTSERSHPYLCQEITAKQMVDGILAARDQFLNGRGGKFKDGYKTILIGYSQGGAVAMATHRYLEEGFSGEAPLAEELHLAGSICGDGPYNPTATLKQYIADGRIFMPVVAPLIIKGMCDASSYLKGQYSLSDYLSHDFLESGVEDMISSKELTTDDIQKRLTSYSFTHANAEEGFVMYCKATDNSTWKDAGFQSMTADNENKYSWSSSDGSRYAPVDRVLLPELIKFFTDGSNATPAFTAIGKALEENNLTAQSWQPEHPIILFHSVHDEVVPFVNYESAMSSLSGPNVHGVKFDAPQVQLHVTVGQIFFLSHVYNYVSDFIDGKVASMPAEQEILSAW